MSRSKQIFQINERTQKACLIEDNNSKIPVRHNNETSIAKVIPKT